MNLSKLTHPFQNYVEVLLKAAQCFYIETLCNDTKCDRLVKSLVINDAKIANIIFSHVRLTFFSFHMASETETPTVRERKR